MNEDKIRKYWLFSFVLESIILVGIVCVGVFFESLQDQNIWLGLTISFMLLLVGVGISYLLVRSIYKKKRPGVLGFLLPPQYLRLIIWGAIALFLLFDSSPIYEYGLAGICFLIFSIVKDSNLTYWSVRVYVINSRYKRSLNNRA